MKKLALVLLALLLCISLCACGKSEEATHADETIAAIGEVTEKSLSQIERAEREVANLSEKDVQSLDNLIMLYDARTAYNQLMADNTEELIAAIGRPGHESLPLIETAREAYEALDDEIKNLVENYAALEEAEAGYKQVLADDVSAAIEAIGQLSHDSLPLIEAARAAYEALDDELKALVGNYAVLEEAEAGYKQLLAETASQAIASIGELNFDSTPFISNARKVYDALDEDIKALVENYDVLEKAEAEISGVRAGAVVALIDELAAMPLESAEDVDALAKAFNAVNDKLSLLSEEEKAMVTNLDLKAEKGKEYNIMLCRNTIGDVRFDMDVVYSHLELYIDFTNTGDKTIKYINFGVKFKNAVGDYEEYRGSDIYWCSDTGPYEPGDGRKYENSYWQFYSSKLSIYEVVEAELGAVEIEYMDGSTTVLNDAEALKAVMKK